MELVVYGAIGPAGGERLLARRLLALALRREYGMERTPETAVEKLGKPYFPAYPDLQFNISHSRGAAVCALFDRPVGVDVELLRTAPERLAGGMADEAFFRLWTAQEATVKHRGLGLAALLRRPEPDRRCRCLEGFLPGYIVTVCPGDGEVRTVKVEERLSG